MNILTPELESIMYSTVMQMQLAIGTSMQRGLKIPITLTQCLEPQPWNKLEIPDSLNGEGVTIAIMASQGGFLLFIPDDGILLPAEYASTLSDPTESLPVMANELQRKLVPNAPEYVGKRIGRAKVFSSMARRAGIDDSAMILPVKLIIGEQESHVWFVGDVPHPERAFAKRNPDSEARSKKSKLFSDEILSNYSPEPDFTSMFSVPESKENLNTPLTMDSETELSLHGGKSNRQKADLNRLLALKKNYGNELPKDNILQPSKQKEPKTKLLRFDLPHESTHNVATQISKEQEVSGSYVESETSLSKDDIIENSPLIVEETSDKPINTIVTNTIDTTVVEKTKKTIEQDIKKQNREYQQITQSHEKLYSTESEEVEVVISVEESSNTVENNSVEYNTVEPDKNFSDNIFDRENTSDNIAKVFCQNESEKSTVENIQNEPVEKTVITVPVSEATVTMTLLNPIFNSMAVPLEAVISRRKVSLNEIVRWKPGSVIEFGEIGSTVNLMAKDVNLAHGQPIECNSHIGLQLK